MQRPKWWMLFSILTIFALTFAVACGDDDDDDNGGDDPTATSENGDNGEGAEGGEITIQTTEPESLDPHRADFSVDITIIQMINRGLYDLLPEGELRPAYADDLPDISDDGLVYTIPIKEGMTWADGETLDANDFVAGIQRTCNGDIGGYYQSILTNVVGCDDYFGGEAAIEEVGVAAVDANTLEITLSQPQATFSVILALWPTYPSPDESLEVGAEWPAPPDTPCNGPFCITEWVAGDHLTLVKNDNYGLTEAKLDQITLRIIDDASTAANAYVAGELDMSRVAPEEVAIYEDRDDFVKQTLPVTIGLSFLVSDEVLSDLDVRLALSRATDREAFNQVVNGNAWIPTTSWVPPEEPGANPEGTFDDVIGFDEEAAQQHLADAGYPDGEGFPGITILLTETASNRTAGEFLQEQWNQILGIDVELEFVDSQIRQQRYNEKQYQLTLGGWGHDYPDAENWLAVGLFETGGSLNQYNCSMPEIDEAIEAARSEQEQEARWDILREVEQLVIENVCGIAPMYHRGNLYLISPDIGGVEPTLEDHYWPQFPEDWFLRN